MCTCETLIILCLCHHDQKRQIICLLFGPAPIIHHADHLTGFPADRFDPFYQFRVGIDPLRGLRSLDPHLFRRDKYTDGPGIHNGNVIRLPIVFDHILRMTSGQQLSCLRTYHLVPVQNDLRASPRDAIDGEVAFYLRFPILYRDLRRHDLAQIRYMDTDRSNGLHRAN